MAELNSIIAQMRADGLFDRMLENRLAQFGTPARRLVGAELLPEVNKPENMYREFAIKYRTVVANSGPRYGPAQKKGNALIGHFDVALSNSDIAYELTAEEYETVSRLLMSNQDMAATARILDLFDNQIVGGLTTLNEVMRWQAIVNASVVLTGDNDYTETIPYPNPDGHRFNATDSWSDDAFDPFIDIMAGADLLAEDGFEVAEIWSSRPVTSILASNDKVRTRTGPTVVSGGSLVSMPGRASRDAVNVALAREGLPDIQEYNLQYSTEAGTAYFLARNVVVMIGTTSQEQVVDQGDNSRILQNTLGYVGIGKPAGKNTPGRAAWVQEFNDKPPRVKMEGWQTSLPVINEPNAIVVIGAIA